MVKGTTVRYELLRLPIIRVQNEQKINIPYNPNMY